MCILPLFSSKQNGIVIETTATTLEEGWKCRCLGLLSLKVQITRSLFINPSAVTLAEA